MMERYSEGPILLAEDDADDRLLIHRALKDAGFDFAVDSVRDGMELMDYLRTKGEFAVPGRARRPKLILLDLNMPRKSGREALQEIKTDPNLQLIPVVILTTSTSPVDVRESYLAGANAYVTKPIKYEEMVNFATALTRFWCVDVQLAPPDAW